MKYLLDPTVFALDESISERDFNIYVNRLLLWDKWLEKNPGDVYVLSNTEDILYKMFYLPVYPVFDKLMKKYKIDYVQAGHLSQAINRLLHKSRKIDSTNGSKVDDDVIFINIEIDKNIDEGSHPGMLKDAFEKMLWYLYCKCQRSEESIETFVVFGKDLESNININVAYQTITEEDGELTEVVKEDKVRVLCRPSLAGFFKDKNTPVDILTKSDTIDDIDLAIRVSVYQNGNLKKVMDSFDNFNFKIQNTFHKDYLGNHYLSQPSFLTSFKDSMSHSLLNMNLVDLEDYRTGKGGNNPQKKHSTEDGMWEAWRWKVTSSVSFQYWRLNDMYKFANIGEHDYYVCQWEN